MAFLFTLVVKTISNEKLQLIHGNETQNIYICRTLIKRKHQMKAFNTLILSSLLLIGFNTNAAELKMDWVKPEQYKDIDAGGDAKAKFQTRLFKDLEKTFQEGAAKLPQDHKLEISMLDIDLAGHVNHSAGVMARRIVTDTDFPRIIFYMVLRDKDNNIVFQGKQSLREKKLKHNSFRMKGSQSKFYMEKDIIEKWFDVALLPALAKS